MHQNSCTTILSLMETDLKVVPLNRQQTTDSYSHKYSCFSISHFSGVKKRSKYRNKNYLGPKRLVRIMSIRIYIFISSHVWLQISNVFPFLYPTRFCIFSNFCLFTCNKTLPLYLLHLLAIYREFVAELLRFVAGHDHFCFARTMPVTLCKNYECPVQYYRVLLRQ